MAINSILYVVILLTICGIGFCMVDDCSKNTYNTNDTFMQFTKEPTGNEFAVIGKFKGLNCCAKGYRSIEWLKDGMLYPWPAGTSGMILYPENSNQTIYTQTVTVDDAGNYTCLLRNDTGVHAHTIQLKVFDKTPDFPKITYVSNDQDVSVGHQVRLFCEAFVGVVHLPDAHSEAIWKKNNYNGTIDDVPRIRQEKVSREDGQTFGTYLIIEDVELEDFGQYICTISKPGRTIELPVDIREIVHVEYLSNPVPWKKLSVLICLLGLLLLTLLILNMRYGLSLRVKFKDRFGNIEDDDGKTSDVLIVYSQHDSSVVLGVLLPTLETRYNYKCSTRELPTNINMWCVNLQESSRRSRRLIAVISTSTLNGNWDTETLYQALKQLNSVDIHLTCILLQELPKSSVEVKNAQGETLTILLRTISVLQWDRENGDQFWLNLRLRLPSKRYIDENGASNEISMTQSNNSRLNRESHANLVDILV